MKKIITLMLGMSLLFGTVSMFAGDADTTKTTKATKAKKTKKSTTTTSTTSKM